MKSKTFNTSSFEDSQREKQDGFLNKGRFYKSVRLIKKTSKNQGDLRFLRLLSSELLQRPNENQARHTKLLEDHLKPKFQWNLLTKSFKQDTCSSGQRLNNINKS